MTINATTIGWLLKKLGLAEIPSSKLLLDYSVKKQLYEGAKKNILTYAGLQELEAELEDLKVNKRKEVAQKIKEAREQGDLSENAEYDAAKDEQRDIEARIEDIEKILKNVEVVAESDIDDTKINVDFEYDEDLEFSIVGSTQTNSLSGKISNESPLGHALIGHEVGDIVEVEMGDTVSKYKVLDIKKKK